MFGQDGQNLFIEEQEKSERVDDLILPRPGFILKKSGNCFIPLRSAKARHLLLLLGNVGIRLTGMSAATIDVSILLGGEICPAQKKSLVGCIRNIKSKHVCLGGRRSCGSQLL